MEGVGEAAREGSVVNLRTETGVKAEVKRKEKRGRVGEDRELHTEAGLGHSLAAEQPKPD